MRIILLRYILIRVGFIMLHARFNSKATDKQSRERMKYVGRRVATAAGINRVVLSVTIFIDAISAHIRVYLLARSGFFEAGLNVLVNKLSERADRRFACFSLCTAATYRAPLATAKVHCSTK